MTIPRNEMLQRLLDLPTPLETTGGQWLDYLAIGLDESAVPSLIALMTDDALNFADGDSKEVWVPLHSWRALAQLQSVEALGHLLELRDRDDENDWLSTDLVFIPAMMGKEALPILTEFLHDDSKELYPRANVVESISELGNTIPEIKAACIQTLRDQLERYEQTDPELNGFVVLGLIDMGAVDCHEIIRRAYESGNVDISICGDLEDVEIELGVRKERSTPRPKYLDFSEDDRRDDPYLTLPPDTTYYRGEKIGRNDPCPCGSGKKYKKCCLR